MKVRTKEKHELIKIYIMEFNLIINYSQIIPV